MFLLYLPDAYLTVRLGNCIQWFRAQEEMEQWRETIEQIQATFLNIIHGHHFMQEI